MIAHADLARMAAECGFEAVGVTPALPVQPDSAQFLEWVAAGMAGRMGYLTDHRADVRLDPRRLLLAEEPPPARGQALRRSRWRAAGGGRHRAKVR